MLGLLISINMSGHEPRSEVDQIPSCSAMAGKPLTSLYPYNPNAAVSDVAFCQIRFPEVEGKGQLLGVPICIETEVDEVVVLDGNLVGELVNPEGFEEVARGRDTTDVDLEDVEIDLEDVEVDLEIVIEELDLVLELALDVFIVLLTGDIADEARLDILEVVVEWLDFEGLEVIGEFVLDLVVFERELGKKEEDDFLMVFDKVGERDEND